MYNPEPLSPSRTAAPDPLPARRGPLGSQIHQAGREGSQQRVLELVALEAVRGLGCRQAAQGVAGAPGVAEVPLQEQDRVLIRALGRRKLFLGAGHEGFAPVQRRELVRLVGGRVVVFRVLPAERQKKPQTHNGDVMAGERRRV